MSSSKIILFLPSKWPYGLIFFNWFFDTDRIGFEFSSSFIFFVTLRNSSSFSYEDYSYDCSYSAYSYYSTSSSDSISSSIFFFPPSFSCLFFSFASFAFILIFSILVNFSPYSSSSSFSFAWLYWTIDSCGAFCNPKLCAKSSKFKFFMLKIDLFPDLYTNCIYDIKARWAKYFTSWCSLQIDLNDESILKYFSMFCTILCTLMFLAFKLSTKPISCSETKANDFPSYLNLAVLPTLCT